MMVLAVCFLNCHQLSPMAGMCVRRFFCSCYTDGIGSTGVV